MKKSLVNNTISVSTVIIILIITAYVFENMCFRLINIDVDVSRSISVAVSIITFFISIFSVGFKKYFSEMKFIKNYLIYIIFIFYISMFLYTNIKYNQEIIEFIKASYQYIYIFLSYPIYYILKKEGLDNRLFRYLSNIVVIGMILLITNAYLYNNYSISFLFVNNVHRSGSNLMRVWDLSSLEAFVVLFNFYKILNTKDRKEKVFCILKIIIIFSALMYVEQTRMMIIALILASFFMYLMKRRTNVKKVIITLILSISIIVMWNIGTFSAIIDLFSLNSKYGLSTSIRLLELEHYLSIFMKNPVFGIGLVWPTISRAYDLLYGAYGTYTITDVGIFGYLASIGINALIIYGIPSMRFIIITYRLNKEKNGSNVLILLIGLIIFLFISSFTLLVLNTSRIFIWPFYLALFEYVNNILLKRNNFQERKN